MGNSPTDRTFFRIISRYVCVFTILSIVASISFAQGIGGFDLLGSGESREAGSHFGGYGLLPGGMGGSPSGLMNSLNMQMHHSMSYTYSNVGGQSVNAAMYTNTMLFKPYSSLSARVDVGFSLLGSRSSVGSYYSTSPGNVYLQNLEICYRPTDSFQIQFTMGRAPAYAAYPFFGYSRPDSEKDLPLLSGE